jgi:hypothetical protein
MASYYSVIQFVPNPLNDERVNVGVITFDDDEVHSRTLQNWSRVHSFVGNNSAEIRHAVDALLKVDLSSEVVRHIASSWRHSLQLTEPKASTSDSFDLLAEISDLMLIDPERQTRSNTKLSVLRDARMQLESALYSRWSNVEAPVRVEQRIQLAGKFAAHSADIAVSNGHVLVAAGAISFARRSTTPLAKDVSDIAWMLDDLQQDADSPPMAVLVAPPDDRRRSDFASAVEVFRSLNATVVERAKIGDWASEVIAELQIAD